MAEYLNTFVSDYRLVEFLGAGGMGEVYRAVHSKIGRVVAIKILSTVSEDPTFTDRFLNEARIHAALHHPNIATLYEFTEVDGQPCIVMEYVEGPTLAERLSEGPLEPSEVLRIFRDVVEAIHYIHSRGVIHRDIKSGNIKISSGNRAKILDFGIAKGVSTPKLTVTGGFIGTLQYCSPEQLAGGILDVRSDIWSLGVLLYEMLTGTVPFQCSTLGALVEKVTQASYPAASTLNDAVPFQLEQVIARCIKAKPSHRYQTTQELQHDIARLDTTPFLRLPRRRSRHERWRGVLVTLKEHWPLSVAAGILISVLSVGLALSFISDVREVRSPGTTASRPAQLSKSPSTSAAASVRKQVAVRISVVTGQADIYVNGERLGTTPYTMMAAVGDDINFVLKQDGFEDLARGIHVQPHTNEYSFPMKRSSER